ncbi:MAG: glutamyl-tRNA reductase [Clostridia bacterium]|jgi:glutamyl-tRNA reductase|nr:glutamyl-tRNA reductase [Clostridia bacterium]MDH7573427.1 glutamyl-tRNA reductase [Clostridia bacterium]
MDLLMAGVNHRTAPVEVREKLALPPGRLPLVLAGLREGLRASGCVWLQTCNRTEAYVTVAAAEEAEEILVGFLREICGLPLAELRPLLYVKRSRAVVDHLFGVASGLDSMLLGETEILGQVRRAHEWARERGFADRLLNALFQQAVSVGKRVRTETRIDQNPVSVSYAAVQMARRIVGSLEGRTVLVIGAGKMGSLTAAHLVGAGVRAVLVSNRSHERALHLAERLGGEAVRFDRLPQHLARADIVISSTDAPHPVVCRSAVAGVLSERQGRPLVFIDIAVPRDVDPAVAELPGVYLYDIDDLEQVVEDSLALRRSLADRARGIVGEEADAFATWMKTLSVVPTITALKRKAEAIRDAEVRRALNRLGKVDPRQERIITRMAFSIVSQLLHDPVVNLKRLAAEGDGAAYAEALQRLFALSDEVSPDEIPAGATGRETGGLCQAGLPKGGAQDGG